MPKDILFRDEAQKKIWTGVNTIADAVACTLGPKGQVVLIEQNGQPPMATKDGVTVAREVSLVDPFERLGADLIREAAKKTNSIAGDGTTTATVLARALYNEGSKLILAGQNPVQVKKDIEEATAQVVKNLTAMATPVDSLEKLEQVASISANDPELGKIIAGLMDKVGKDGLITLEEAPTFGIETEITQGMKLEGGFIRGEMVNNTEKMVFESADCPILVADLKITMVQELLSLLEDMSKKGKKELLIVCDSFEGEALAFALLNKAHQTFNIVAMRCPGIGDHRRREQMKDICALTGATFVAEETGKDIKTIKSDVLGKARKVIVTKENTSIIGGYGEQSGVDIRVASLKADIESTKSDYDGQKFRERLGHLTGSVGVIRIGGINEVEIREKKQRVEDAVNATRAAQDEGIVVGGGIGLLRAASRGVAEFSVVSRAAQAPLKTIAENAGKNGEVVLANCLASVDFKGTAIYEDEYGYNAKTDRYENLMEAGVIDPVKVTRTALENASSIACLLLTSKAALVTAKEPK